MRCRKGLPRPKRTTAMERCRLSVSRSPACACGRSRLDAAGLDLTRRDLQQQAREAAADDGDTDQRADQQVTQDRRQVETTKENDRHHGGAKQGQDDRECLHGFLKRFERPQSWDPRGFCYTPHNHNR